MLSARIRSIGSSFPKSVLTRDEVVKAGTETGNLKDNFGEVLYQIPERRHVGILGETAVSLGTGALMDAMIRGRVGAAEIDWVMVNSNFSDAESPHDAVSIADNCGILAPGLDINDNCNSFLSGLPIVTSLLERGVYRMVAFVCSAAWYRGIRPGTDSGPLADGAVAVIFEAADVPTPFIDCRRSLVDRRFKDLVSMKLSVLNGRVNYLQNRRIAGFPEFIMTEAPAAVLGFIKDNGLTPEGIDWFFPHQPAHNAAHRWCRQLGFPPEKMVETFNEIGNITSAVIPYNIMRAVLSGGFASGSRALLLSLGGGFVLNAAVCNLHVADDFISNG